MLLPYLVGHSAHSAWKMCPDICSEFSFYFHVCSFVLSSVSAWKQQHEMTGSNHLNVENCPFFFFFLKKRFQWHTVSSASVKCLLIAVMLQSSVIQNQTEVFNWENMGCKTQRTKFRFTEWKMGSLETLITLPFLPNKTISSVNTYLWVCLAFLNCPLQLFLSLSWHWHKEFS